MICLIISIYLLVKVTKQEQIIKDLYSYNVALSTQLDKLQTKVERKKRIKKCV